GAPVDDLLDDVGVVHDDEVDLDPVVGKHADLRLDIGKAPGGHQGADVLLDGLGAVLGAYARLDLGHDLGRGHLAVAAHEDIGDHQVVLRPRGVGQAQGATQEDSHHDRRSACRGG